MCLQTKLFLLLCTFFKALSNIDFKNLYCFSLKTKKIKHLLKVCGKSCKNSQSCIKFDMWLHLKCSNLNCDQFRSFVHNTGRP